MSVDSQIKEFARTTQAEMRQRSNELVQQSRQRVAEQVEQLKEQVQQLQAQSRQLRKALRLEELTHEIAQRSRKVTGELAKRGELLLEPIRKRDRTFWMIVGFGVGLVAAGTITYQLVRRMARQETELDEHIELPQSDSWNGSPSRPAGEIRHIEQGGASVATLEIVDVETIEQPADAAYVGVESTKLYYAVDTDLEPEDLVYFATEEEARARGFTAAE